MAHLPDHIDYHDLVPVLRAVLDRSADGGATVITLDGQPVAAVVSMDDYHAAEEAIDQRLSATPPPEDDGTRHSLEELLAEAGDCYP